MKKLVLLFVYSLFIINFLFSQETNSSKVHELEIEAEEFYNKTKYDSAAHFFIEAAEIYKKKQNWLNCVKNLRLAAHSFYHDYKGDSALSLILEAENKMNTFFHKNETNEKIEVYVTSGDIYDLLGAYDSSIVKYKKALYLSSHSIDIDSSTILMAVERIGLTYLALI